MIVCVDDVFIMCQLQLHKLDVQSKQFVSWSATNSVIGEPTFLPRPYCADEDDGANNNNSFL